MIQSTALLSVEMSKVAWQDAEKKRWMAGRDKAYNYYKGITEEYTNFNTIGVSGEIFIAIRLIKNNIAQGFNICVIIPSLKPLFIIFPIK